MNWDDVVYLVLLIIAILCGSYVRRINSKEGKQWASTIIGIVIMAIVSGIDIVYPILCTGINICIILFVDIRHSPNISFVFTFVFLAFSRTAHYFGLPEPTPHLNAIEMIHTLKIVGLAFEMRDTHMKESSSGGTLSPEYVYTKVKPSVMDIFHYSFCYIGLLAGPYFKYRTYWDWLNMPYASHVDTIPYVLTRATNIPLYVVCYLIGDSLYPQQYIENGLYDRSFLYRWWYMTPLFFNFRMRMYTGFILSECACIAAGLGLYPKEAQAKPGKGPSNYDGLHDPDRQVDSQSLTKLEYDFETIHNVNEYGAEFVPTMREGMKCWNTTVQYWLAVFVHKRVRKFRVAITMFVSAFWHGVYPGYYFCLLGVPLQLLAEDSMDRAFRRNATPQGQKLYDWICWVFKMQAFAYLGMGFYLLNIGSILTFWYSLYFSGHILMVCFYLFGRFVSSRRRQSRTRTRNEAEGVTESNQTQEKKDN